MKIDCVDLTSTFLSLARRLDAGINPNVPPGAEKIQIWKPSIGMKFFTSIFTAGVKHGFATSHMFECFTFAGMHGFPALFTSAVSIPSFYPHANA